MSTRYILAGGYLHKAPDASGEAFCRELAKGIAKKPVRILDCLFARTEDSWEEKYKEDQMFFAKHLEDFELELADPKKFTEQVRNSDVIFFQGGTPRQLISLLDLDGGWRKELDGKVLAGSSGGADALCKYYGVGKTHRVGEGMGLLPVKCIPHWKSDYSDHPVEWDALLRELKEYKEDLPVYTIPEGEYVVIEA